MAAHEVRNGGGREAQLTILDVLATRRNLDVIFGNARLEVTIFEDTRGTGQSRSYWSYRTEERH